ncbi:hypothetical protein ABEB36_006830 [Hypothenemus hampei]|uniref:Homologous-pairing protein 2 homolog n=1 Tax=Hypothenemus hampei TaxID=57062 RepID=A0ABD1ERX4_HYPHA
MEKAIIGFLEENNRPHSMNDILNGLPEQSNKKDIQVAIDHLTNDNWIDVKTYGKQKVYYLKQNTKRSSKELNEELLAIDRKINEFNGKIKKYSSFEKQGEEHVSLAELLEKKEHLEKQLRSIKDSLKKFNGVYAIDAEVKKKVQSDYDKYLSFYRKRKRLCLDMLDAILENYPKTKRHLFEEIGIETDEDVGFQLV